MRIAHVGVAGPFTENMSYQDNILSHQNALDGHEVLYIANEYFFKNGVSSARLKRKKNVFLSRIGGTTILRTPTSCADHTSVNN